MNSTVNAIASKVMLQNTTAHKEEEATNQFPAKEDDPCYRCDHLKILVFLVTCCNATVCKKCAHKMVKYRDQKRCPFCKQRIGNIIKV